MSGIAKCVGVIGAVAAALSTACAARAPVPAAAPKAPPSARPDHRDARADFRPTAWEAFSHGVDVPPRRVVRELLCAAAEPEICEDSCLSLEPHDATQCALDLAYAADDEARALARDLFALTGAVPGVERWHEIDSAFLGRVPIDPVLPTGAYRRHLAWLRDAITDIDRVFAGVTKTAPRPVLFRTRPHGFRFFKTKKPSFPSAYALDGIVGYNVEGPLHDTPENVTSTLLHEIFHLNDEGRGQWWSQRVLGPLFEQILATCHGRHACFTRFAPSDDRVPGGTYYAFDRRVHDVREYAAEVALRWFREQRAALEGQPLSAPPFKCGSAENAEAWSTLVEEFFGGADLTAECE